MMILDKLITTNRLFDTVIGGTIAEYDIKSAGATAIRELKGDEVYYELMSLEKKERNITIGKMQLREKGLSKKLNSLMLKYLNTFLQINKIKKVNFINSTRDSVFIYNKIPYKLKFGNVTFRNKDGVFSSLYKLNSKLSLLFDSMSGKVICKGVKDSVVSRSILLNEFLRQPLLSIENNQKRGYAVLYSILSRLRNKYIGYNDRNIFKDVLNDNKLGIIMDDKLVYLDSSVNANDESITNIVKESNYVNIILPIMRSAAYNI